MKKVFATMLLFALTAPLISQTPVPGDTISGTWDLAGSPYLIEGETIIKDGTTLTIEAGVEVIWQNDSSSMYVQGRIIADGTESDSIVFTSANFLTTWKGIRFENTSAGNDTSSFAYCKFNYGKAYGEWPDNCGGAIAAINFDKLSIDHCCFHDNKAVNIQPEGTAGGAIVLLNSSPEITNSKFENNISLSGAAIFCYNESNPEILNNIFAYNLAIDSSYFGNGFGGAISCYINSSPDIKNNTFCYNIAEFAGGAIACIDHCDPIIDHNLFYGDTAKLGGGIEIQASDPIINNNTIANNYASGSGGGISIWQNSTPQIRNTILWGNTAEFGNQVYIGDDTSEPDFYYSDIQGGQDSIGGFQHTGAYKQCIDSDPLFEDMLLGNFYLTAASPCIDSGDPSMLDPDSTRCDIGAFYFPQAVGYSEFGMQKPESSIVCIPNPARGKSEIRYQISEIRYVVLSVFDIHGKEITRLISETQTAGEHTVHFNTSELPDGLYIIRLQAGKESAMGKLLVVH